MNTSAHTLVPVILAGGSGQRLWPLSREDCAKQFLALMGKTSLFQDTILRAVSLPNLSRILIITAAQNETLVRHQIKQLSLAPTLDIHLLLEPCRKNTAPAVALASLYTSSPKDILLLFPSDHYLPNVDAFNQRIIECIDLANNGHIITFGIQPSRPETGYGYIRAGKPYQDSAAVYVDTFIEKPNKNKAKSLIATKQCYWNSGILMFQASLMCHELKRFAPELFSVCHKAIMNQSNKNNSITFPESIVATCPATSIDYAVMEKTNKALMIPYDGLWSDLGDWASLFAAKQSNQSNIEQGNVVAHQVDHCYLHAESRLIAAVGIKDTVVIETKDAVLVANKNDTENMKALINKLAMSTNKKALYNNKVFETWGTSETITQRAGLGIEHVIIHPGQHFLLNNPTPSAINVLFIKGQASVVFDNKTQSYTMNTSATIPAHTSCSIVNVSTADLAFIYVSTEHQTHASCPPIESTAMK